MISSLAVDVPYWGQSLLRVLGGLVAVLLPAGTIVYLFLFKMMSFMQSRLGPMEAGPYGSMQLLAEVGKWLQKEDLAPENADVRIFRMAPLVVLVSTFLLVVIVPFGPDAYFTNFETGIFFGLAVSSISVLGILIAGWASANKYSLLGGLRAAGQLIAYELPLVLATLGVVIQAGSMNLQDIVVAQNTGEIFGFEWLGNPFIFTQFVGFIIFMIAVQAELTQPPFDMPIAESELVSGYMTEYSGFRFLIFFIAEFATAGVFAFIAVGAVPRRLGRPVRLVRLGRHRRRRQLDEPRRSADHVHQDVGADVHHHVGAVQLPPLPRGPTADVRLEGAHPARPAQHGDHRNPESGCLMPKVPGLIKGLGVTFGTLDRHGVKGANTVQYPHEKETPPIRARGVIALHEGNCTACMLCARSCPDWCIYIEGHKQLAPPRRAGGKPRQVNHLDRFDIDYALCMYCGICVEVCPFDALFWSPEYEYSEPRIADLLHDKDKLGEWMQTVPEAPELEVGAQKK